MEFITGDEPLDYLRDELGVLRDTLSWHPSFVIFLAHIQKNGFASPPALVNTSELRAVWECTVDYTKLSHTVMWLDDEAREFFRRSLLPALLNQT